MLPQDFLPIIPMQVSRGSCVRCGSSQMDRELKVKISEICSLLDVDGIRGDITTNKAARALAAYQGETVVTLEHVRAVIGLCLNHRRVPPHTCCLLRSRSAPLLRRRHR